jgi:glycosyltransferase involved in cell wall biosynthesis
LKIAECLKITIITVCKNSEHFLNETIESVVSQTYQNIQYIVIDGNSTDGTVDIIKRHSANIDTWFSEPDDGMYDAINKALKHAIGDYILVLNSDDILANNNTIQSVVALVNKEKLAYYYGNIIKSKDHEYKKVKLFTVTYKQLLFSTHGTFAPHPCFFISASLNKELGGYSLAYKYASDYDYILRAFASKGSSGKRLNLFISKFRIHDNSITASGKIEEERKKILQQHKYYQRPYVSRFCLYYLLWIYYKIINLGQKYKAG